jgi:hypothetical protein
MRKAFYFLVAVLLSACVENTVGIRADEAGAGDDLRRLFTLQDAEQVMGEPLYITDTSFTHSARVSTWHCAYKAKAPVAEGKQPGTVYFVAEHYSTEEGAHKKYASIKKANEKHEGIRVLDDVGDEAYFHSDGENFYFIMARKGAKVMTMKVNKITAATSLDAFNRVARSIAADLGRH